MESNDNVMSFSEAILTVRNALGALQVMGLNNARLLVSACDDLDTIANAVDLYVKSTSGGGEENNATKENNDSND